ncbi:YbaL family putative K(+) efflux transporter [Aquabacterium sp. J223]|uniref:YbaL family putative K(+) efflux transporter n=1 Tax=Aquabacterium sp. J223 TaxID=2898431 RepID=UPI0021ADC0AF|nr:YbaL family putative K(+) efflux transporter [Aquabacterium sp. J223]UUX95974.1 Kef family K(+) transporter [Aquabacterium sp. J223]
MHHDISLITTLAVGFGLALLLGVIAVRLKLPALVGYLLAGVAIGPGTPGFVADVGLAGQLAEVGVMLLMFGVGLHFSLDDLLAVRRIALPGAVVQIAVATAMGFGLAQWWGWSVGAGLVFGLALSVASTVVLLKALDAQGLTETGNGRIAIGWLVVEDLAMVLVLVLLPALSGVLGGKTDGHAGGSLGWTLAKTLAQVVAFVVVMLVAGRRVLPWLLWQVTRTGSRELFTLCVVAAALSIAYGATALFGVSFALGAFFAGMVLRESEFSHRAADESLPLRDAFAVLFFVSVGMLFEPRVLVDEPLKVLAVVAVIVLGKSIAAMAVVLLLRYPPGTALTVSASLAQIGEFSFILAAMGVALGLLPPEGQSLIVAGALISIAVNPWAFRAARPLQTWLQTRSALARRLAQRDDPLSELPPATEAQYLSRQVVVVGHGRVGKRITAALQAAKVPFVVAERHRERVEQLRAEGLPAVWGDAAEASVLIQAHIARARLLLIATSDVVGVRQMIETARQLNPSIEILVRAHSTEEVQWLSAECGATAFLAEDALAAAMAERATAVPPMPVPGAAPA